MKYYDARFRRKKAGIPHIMNDRGLGQARFSSSAGDNVAGTDDTGGLK